MLQGLTDQQVREKIAEGKVNKTPRSAKTTLGGIVARNVLTIFNLVNVILAGLIIFVGSYRNLLFIVIAIANIVIGIFNEVRAKKIIDKLAIVSEKKQIVIRNGKKREILSEEIVEGDYIVYKMGSQITVDAEVVDGEVEVNESFITGESDNLVKKIQDELLSGSFVAKGECVARVVAVGGENFVNKLAIATAKLKPAESKLFSIINKIIKYISIALIPIGVVLLISRLNITGATVEVAVTSTVASLISMIPEGLVLLTSSVLALAAIRLARQKILVQDLYAVETLARVDAICLDKTGTITDSKGKIRKSAPRIIEFFKQSQIKIFIISGDVFEVVDKVAHNVGLDDPRTFDLSKTKQHDYDKLIQNYNAFAAASPAQKKSLVMALKKAGYTVAMTGDGVNDVLAMKEADCSIAIGDGTDAARRVSKIVLLKSDFAAITKIIAEGRQTINNLERSATLFLSKTTYATILSVLFVFLPLTYPFMPINMSLLNFLCIGFPAFVLALEPNQERIKNQFVKNIMKYSVPTGIATALNILAVTIIANVLGFTPSETITVATLTTLIVDVFLIYRISRPLKPLRVAIFVVIAIIMLAVFAIPFVREFFGLVIIDGTKWLVVLGAAVISILCSLVFSKLFNNLVNNTVA